MKVQELHKRFEAFEIKNDLFDSAFSTPNLWEIVRLSVYLELQLEFGNIEKKLGINRSPFNLLRILIKNLKYIFFYSPFLIKKGKSLILGTGRRIADGNGVYWDIYTDLIIEEIGEDKFSLIENMSFSGEHLNPVRTKNISYSDSFHLLVLIGTQIMTYFSTNEENETYKKLESLINNEFKTNINFCSMLKKKVSNYKAELFFYQLLFSIIKPKSVGMINGTNRKAALTVCRKLGITSYEIQHGTLNRLNIGYSLPVNKQKIYPQYFLFSGTYWKNCFINPIDEKHSFLLGYPFLEHKLNNFKNIPKKRQVLFISQALTTVFEFAVSLSKVINSDIEIVVKLHPGEYGSIEELKATYGTAIKIIGPGTDIYHLLAESKWVFGVYSTVMYEALKFKCICYLINSPGIEYMDDLIKMGAATLVNNAAEVNLDFNKDSPKVDADLFFKSDWKQNIKAFEKVIS